jgi:hypothetical protein
MTDATSKPRRLNRKWMVQTEPRTLDPFEEYLSVLCDVFLAGTLLKRKRKQLQDFAYFIHDQFLPGGAAYRD